MIPPDTSPSLEPALEAGQPSPGLRSALTVILFIHIFCAVGLLIAGQVPYGPEDGLLLSRRFAYTMSSYGRLLNFETSARYYLTHATEDDVEHRIEYLPPEASPTDSAAWVSLTSGVRGTDRFHRHQHVADILAYFAGRQDDDSAAFVAASIGRHLYNQMGVKAQQLRVRKHVLQNMETLASAEPFRRDPNDPSYFREVYRAQILDFGNGDVRVQKVEERGQVAPATRGRNL